MIVDELMPVLYKEFNISKDPERHGIGGSSSGAIAAFTVAWQRPNEFRKVLSNVGSFVDLRGGNAYPDIIGKSEKKPIRIFLCDGRNDNRGQRPEGAPYNRGHGLVLPERPHDAGSHGEGLRRELRLGHQCRRTGQARPEDGRRHILPEMMRWLWRDHQFSSNPKDVVERSFNLPRQGAEKQ